MFKEIFYAFIATLLLLGITADPVFSSSFSTGNEGGVRLVQEGGHYFDSPVEPTTAVVGDSVILSSTKGDIIATPHTLTASGWVKVDFTSRSFTGPVEISFGFNGVDQVQMVKGETWESYPHEKTRMVEGIIENTFAPQKIISTSVDSKAIASLGNSELNPYKATITYESTDQMTMKPVQKTDTIAYSSIDEKGNYVYQSIGQVAEKYTETYTDWKEVSSVPRTETKSVAGASKWNTLQGQSIVQGSWYSARFWVEIPFKGTEEVFGKYNIAVKSAGADLNTAIVLDPWYSSVWPYRKQLLCYGSSNSTVTNYQKLIRVYNTTATDTTENIAQYTTGTYYNGGDGVTLPSANMAWGQTFTAKTNATVKKVWLNLVRFGTPTNLITVSIRNVTSSAPGTLIYCYANLNTTFVTLNTTSRYGNWYEFDMGAGSNLIAGTSYALCVNGTTSATNYTYVVLSAPNYIEGGYYYSLDGGTSWGDGSASFDMVFQVLSSTTGSTPLRIGCGGYSKSDFSDLRFTASDGSTLLDYWVENYTTGASAYADVWVELDTIPQMTGTNQNQTFYMYYGNSGASSVSNGTNTFIKFDNFDSYANGTDINGQGFWTSTTGTGNVTVTSELAYSGNKSLKLWGRSSQVSFYTSANATSSSFLYSFKVYKENNAAYANIFGDSTNTLGFYVDTDELISSYTLVYSSGKRVVADTWYRQNVYQIVYNNVFHGSINDTFSFIFPITVGPGYDGVYYFTATSGVGNDTYFDDFFVSKFIAPQPLWGIPGSQDAASSFIPTVTTQNATSIGGTSFTGNGNITNLNSGGNATVQGFCYMAAATGDPTTANSTANNTGSFTTGTFTKLISGLAIGTNYRVRAFAVNPAGIGYGTTVNATTASTPTIVTLPQTAITATTITGGGGNVTLFNAATNVTVWGIASGTSSGIYSVYNNLTVGSPKLAPFSFTQDVGSGLTQGNAYYYAAFAQSDIGIAYGNEIANMTLPYPPTALTATVTSPTSVTLAYTHSAVGTGATAYAYCRYSETDYPATVSSGSLGFDNTTLSSVAITGLTPGHTYYFRVWAMATEGGMSSGYSATYADAYATPSYATGFTGPALYENACGVMGSAGYPVWGANWAAQTFNVTTDAHTVTRVGVKLIKTGTPLTVTVSIKRTIAGLPYGPDIGSGTLDPAYISSAAWAWYYPDITSTIAGVSDLSLESNTQYAIVVSNPGGTSAANSVSVYNWTAPPYSGGNRSYSIDGSYTWSLTNEDFCFEVWGYPCLEMISAKVYQTYINSGDWLVVCHYRDVYPPYYPGQDPKQYFVLQIMDGSNVVAQSALQQWGYRPGSIYMSAATVIPLEWGHPYRVRIAGTYSNPPYAEQVLSAADWIGPDLVRLDSYLISMATLMESYYSTTFTTWVANFGQIFNTEGGVLFTTGIPYLMSVRPSLFIVSTSPPTTPPATNGTQQLKNQYNMTTMLGPYISAKLTQAGVPFGGIDGQTVGAIGTIIVYIIVAGFAFMAGQSGAAIFLAFPIFLGGGLLGVIPLPVMFIALALASFLLIYHFWLSRA